MGDKRKMIKEKLEKEAKQYINSKQKPLTEHDLIAFAESREKQIQIDAEQIRALQIQNGELTDKVMELQKENETLQRNNKRLNKEYHIWNIKACNIDGELYGTKQKLTEAKEIIRRFYRYICWREGFMELNDFNVWKAKAEAFLKE